MLLTGGSEQPFDFFDKSPGRDLDGLISRWISCRSKTAASRANRRARSSIRSAPRQARLVIGGGDTGTDCIGTSFRQGAKSVTQLEIMPRPPEKENKDLSWPHWPLKLRVSSSQAEGAKVEYSISTTGFCGKNGKI